MNEDFLSSGNEENVQGSKWDALMSDWGMDKTAILIGILGIVLGVGMYFFASANMALLAAGIGLSILIVGGAMSADEHSSVIGTWAAVILTIIALVVMWQGPDYFASLSSVTIWIVGAVFIASLWVARSVGNRV